MMNHSWTFRRLVEKIIAIVLLATLLVGAMPAGAVYAEEATDGDTNQTEPPFDIETTRNNRQYITEDLVNALVNSDTVFSSTTGGFPWDSEDKDFSWTYYNGIMMDAILLNEGLADPYILDNTKEKQVLDFYLANILDNGKVNDTSNSNNTYRENELDSIPPTRALFDIIDTLFSGSALWELETYNKFDIHVMFKKAIDYTYSVMLQYETVPNTGSGSDSGGSGDNFKYKISTDPNDTWNTYPIALDGLYMAQPFFMEIANAMERLDQDKLNTTNFVTYTRKNNDADAPSPDQLYTDVYKRMYWIGNNLYDENTHLYNHGYGPTAGVNGQFWLRAVGWYAAALADVIDMYPDSTDTYKSNKVDLIEIEKKLFDGMIEYQDASTGMWRNVINEPAELSYTYTKDGQTITNTNRLETSGSALMAYAMMKSFSGGYVGLKYGEAGLKAFNGICANKLSEDHKTLHDIYKSSDVKTSPEEYLASTYENNDAKGVGPLIMAAYWAVSAAEQFYNGCSSYTVTLNGESVDFMQAYYNEEVDTSGFEVVGKYNFYNDVVEYRQIPRNELSFTADTAPNEDEPGGNLTISHGDTTITEITLILESRPPENPEFTGHSLLISDGQINLVFLMDIRAVKEEKREGTSLDFYVRGKKIDTISTKDVIDEENPGYVSFVCYLNSIQMAEDVKAVFHYTASDLESGSGSETASGSDTGSGDLKVEDTCSIQEYCTTMQEKYKENNELLTPDSYITQSITNYGYYIQPYLSAVNNWKIGEDYAEMTAHFFLMDGDTGLATYNNNSYNTNYQVSYGEQCDANEEYDFAQIKENLGAYGTTSINKGDSALENVSMQLEFDTRTTLNLQLTAGEEAEINNAVAVFDDTSYAFENKDGIWIATIEKIPATKMFEQVVIQGKTGENEFSATLYPISFVGLVLDSNTDDAEFDKKAKNAVSAFYEFCILSKQFTDNMTQ